MCNMYLGNTDVLQYDCPVFVWHMYGKDVHAMHVFVGLQQ